MYILRLDLHINNWDILAYKWMDVGMIIYTSRTITRPKQLLTDLLKHYVISQLHNHSSKFYYSPFNMSKNIYIYIYMHTMHFGYKIYPQNIIQASIHATRQLTLTSRQASRVRAAGRPTIQTQNCHHQCHPPTRSSAFTPSCPSGWAGII